MKTPNGKYINDCGRVVNVVAAAQGFVYFVPQNQDRPSAMSETTFKKLYTKKN